MEGGREEPKCLTGQQYLFNRLEPPGQRLVRAVGPRVGGPACAECRSFFCPDVAGVCYLIHGAKRSHKQT